MEKGGEGRELHKITLLFSRLVYKKYLKERDSEGLRLVH